MNRRIESVQFLNFDCWRTYNYRPQSTLLRYKGLMCHVPNHRIAPLERSGIHYYVYNYQHLRFPCSDIS